MLFINSSFNNTRLLAGGCLAVFSLLVHAVLIQKLDVLIFPDSEGYLALAENIRNWTWQGFHFRTPGYPAFLALIQAVARSTDVWYVCAVQVMLSSLIPVGLYWIFLRIGDCIGLALLCSTLYFIDVAAIAMNFAVLTEGLTHLLLIGTLSVGVALLKQPKLGVSFFLGVLLFALMMVRPGFAPLGVIVGVILLICWKIEHQNLKETILAASIVIFLPILLILGWCLEVKRETGKFTISHITGIALFNQVNPDALELESLEHQELLKRLKAEVIKQRAQHNTHLNAGWNLVGPEDGPRPWETADEMKAISTRLIVQQPKYFIKKVFANLNEYWLDMPTYVYAESTTYKNMREGTFSGLFYGWFDQQYWLRPGRILFSLFLASFLFVAYYFSRASTLQKGAVSLIVASIIVCMLTHVLVNGADLARYRMPVQTLYLCTLVYLLVAIGGQLALSLPRRIKSEDKGNNPGEPT